MLKNVIAPIQAWLLSQGRCVADGQPLDKSKKERKEHTPVAVFIFTIPKPKNIEELY